MVYWDDTAMVLVRRSTSDPAWLAKHEYRLLRPDDLDHLWRRLEQQPGLETVLANELTRRLRSSPPSLRAQQIAEQFTNRAESRPRP